ncbi:hypothetical protein PL11201_470086 [Planktothrix sp. PCC 11201]|nr:hypothetical protein PL11201_470086 [Planktothrix sp. PCC 11201]
MSNFMSDEDRMIEIYIKHRNLKRFVIKKLKEQGINCQETTKNELPMQKSLKASSWNLK